MKDITKVSKAPYTCRNPEKKELGLIAITTTVKTWVN
jgi:hypothetical protein